MNRIDMFNTFKIQKHKKATGFLLPVNKQIRAWRKANRKMKWGIPEKEFADIEPAPPLSTRDHADGFIGNILSYGFGDDGEGNADAVLSGRFAWAFARRRRWTPTWQCRYIDFDKADHFRLRPEAPRRPKGFYFTRFRPGDAFLTFTVKKYLKTLSNETGCGPEGLQMIIITHPHVAKRMNQRQIAFMALADYDVAPYGFNDFFDCLQIFCSNDTLGLGIGNVEQNYPLFGIPTLRFPGHLDR
jgi:hypothetical protein